MLDKNIDYTNIIHGKLWAANVPLSKFESWLQYYDVKEDIKNRHPILHEIAHQAGKVVKHAQDRVDVLHAGLLEYMHFFM